MRDTAVSNFAMSFNLQLTPSTPISRARFRVLIGAKAGSNSRDNGLAVQIDDKARINVYSDGEQVVENLQIENLELKSVYLVYVYVDKELTVYKADYKEGGTYSKNDLSVVFTYNDTVNRGGALAFYTQNASARMNNIRGYGLTRGQDYTKLDLFTNIKIDSPTPPDPEITASPYTGDYRNDFNNKEALADFTRYSGAVSVKDGNLVIDGLNGQNWDAGAGFAHGTFENFELETRLKIKNAYGWAAVEFNKSSPSVTHQQSALTILISLGGGSLFLGNDVNQPNTNVNAVADGDGYLTLHLKVQNGLITFDLGGQSVSVRIENLERNSNLTSGYISLNSGANHVSYDYISIKQL